MYSHMHHTCTRICTHTCTHKCTQKDIWGEHNIAQYSNQYTCKKPFGARTIQHLSGSQKGIWGCTILHLVDAQTGIWGPHNIEFSRLTKRHLGGAQYSIQQTHKKAFGTRIMLHIIEFSRLAKRHLGGAQYITQYHLVNVQKGIWGCTIQYLAGSQKGIWGCTILHLVDAPMRDCVSCDTTVFVRRATRNTRNRHPGV